MRPFSRSWTRQSTPTCASLDAATSPSSTGPVPCSSQNHGFAMLADESRSRHNQNVASPTEPSRSHPDSHPGPALPRSCVLGAARLPAGKKRGGVGGHLCGEHPLRHLLGDRLTVETVHGHPGCVVHTSLPKPAAGGTEPVEVCKTQPSDGPSHLRRHPCTKEGPSAAERAQRASTGPVSPSRQALSSS